MKKKLVINMSKLSVGGMEKALVDLINKSNLRDRYDIDLLLVYDTNDKNYIDFLPEDVNVEILYKGMWGLKGKIVAFLKLLYKIIFIKQYDASICYSHHHKILATLTRRQSDNNICFIHADLIASRTKKELNTLCKNLKFDKFKKIVCVSECAKRAFEKIYPHYKGKVKVANNYIDEENIINKSTEKINERKSNLLTFINVCRHEECSKKVSRILEATKRLNKEKYEFKLLLVGEGDDTKSYKEYVQKNKLNNVEFVGLKRNPFPYYKLADAFVFSSLYEGYGIVLNEARVLNLPIITTNVGDAATIIKEGYGILCENSNDGIYTGMKEYLDKGFKIKKKFNAKQFNQKISKSLDEIIEM